MRYKLNAAFPIIEQLHGGPPRLLVRDLAAGITVAALLVPQGMAYAELAGLPAVNGLYASFVPILAYALFGSSRQLALGPTATVAVLTATVIEPLSHGNASLALALAATLALLVGGICILGGLLRGGFVVNFLSQPVLSGYVTGAALVIAASQLGKFWATASAGTRSSSSLPTRSPTSARHKVSRCWLQHCQSSPWCSCAGSHRAGLRRSLSSHWPSRPPACSTCPPTAWP